MLLICHTYTFVHYLDVCVAVTLRVIGVRESVRFRLTVKVKVSDKVTVKVTVRVRILPSDFEVFFKYLL